jgi:hypothetical protein
VFSLLSTPLSSGAASRWLFKLVLRRDTGLRLLGIFMPSICTDDQQFVLAQGLCTGVSNGCMFVPMISVTSTYSDASMRNFATGVVLCGSGTGYLAIPTFIAQ